MPEKQQAKKRVGDKRREGSLPGNIGDPYATDNACRAGGSGRSGRQSSLAYLDSLDLMQLEPVLCGNLRRLFSFKGHSLHFPVMAEGETPPLNAEFLPREKKLLLPLWRNGQFLGLFVARGVEPSGIKSILPALVSAASICLDNLALYRETLRDAVTGLFSRESLLEQIVFELEQLRGSLRPSLPELPMPDISPAFAGAPFPSGAFTPGGASVRFSLLVIRLNGLAAVVREHGYLRADKLLAALAAALEEHKPGQAIAARSGEAEFALLLPASGPQACRELGGRLVEALDSVRLSSELTGRKLAVSVSVGYVNCPRDLDGISRQSAGEQARILLRRARMAAAMAYESLRQAGALRNRRLFAPGEEPPLPLLSYSGILAEGGRVLQMVPLSRMQVSLGKAAGARPGQKFAVWGYVLEPAHREDEAASGKAAQRNSRQSGQGQHRLVRRYKGEIVLVDVRQNESTAELVYCDDPYFPPEAGDQLILNRLDGAGFGDSAFYGQSTQAFQSAQADQPIPSVQNGQADQPELSGSSIYGGSAGAYDPSTGFLNYSDFLPRWCRARELCESSCLLLTRFGWSGQELPFSAGFEDYDGEEGEEAPNESAPDRQWEQLMRRCAELVRRAFGASCLYGRYALNSFIIFVPDTAPDAVAAVAARVFAELRGGGVDLQPVQSVQPVQPVQAMPSAHTDPAANAGNIGHAAGAVESGTGTDATAGGHLHAAFGIAPHPFLDFRKADGLENAQKALEYALLLPEPQVGILDTLALNISADRRFSLGDQLGAISEYKKALLCDEDNILAWNSLGVTLAGLGRHSEARRSFEEALKRDSNDFTALYNLGQLCQTLREHAEAERLYRHCLELDAENVYTIHRLGQLAEQRGDNAGAKELYERAQALPGGQMLTRRSLARLAIREGRLDDAREELHEALLINPNDAQALQMLASLYLDAGEDPRVAESLARQSAALRPDFKAAWMELARALEAVGKQAEAREAMMKAGEL